MAGYLSRIIGLTRMRLLLAALVLSTMIGVTTANKAYAYSYVPSSYTTPIAYRCYPVTQWMMTG